MQKTACLLLKKAASVVQIERGSSFHEQSLPASGDHRAEAIGDQTVGPGFEQKP